MVYLLNSGGDIQNFKDVQKGFQENYSQEIRAFDIAEMESKRQDMEKTIRPRPDDFIVCIGSKAFSLASRLYPENAIIFSSLVNWKRLSLTKHAYGISQDVAVESQIAIFRMIFPDVRKIGVAYSRQFNQEWFEEAAKVAEGMKIRLVGKEFDTSLSAGDFFESLFSEVDAVWLITDPTVITRDTFPVIMEKSMAQKKPVFTYAESFVKNGAVLSISADMETVGQQTSFLVERLLKKESVFPRVQYPAGTRISVNMGKIREMNIKINESALGNVNEVVE